MARQNFGVRGRRYALPCSEILRAIAAHSAPTPSKSQFRFEEKVESTMSSYVSAIAVFLLVLSPLFVPVAVTLAPLASSAVRRVARIFGVHRPAPRLV
jgi:hypothetical protein